MLTAHNRIPAWENARRRRLLMQFRNNVVKYFDELRDKHRDEPESAKAQEARQAINLMLREVSAMVEASGVPTVREITEAPIAGGRTRCVELIHNIFNLIDLDGDPKSVTDVIDQSIGVYKFDTTKAWVRTFNALFWLERLLQLIASVPFRLLGGVGFDQERIETSRLGRLVKFAFQIVLVVAALLQIRELLGKP